MLSILVKSDNGLAIKEKDGTNLRNTPASPKKLLTWFAVLGSGKPFTAATFSFDGFITPALTIFPIEIALV